MASKDEFSLRLQEAVGRVARFDLLIGMGDMNARVGTIQVFGVRS